MLLLITGSVDGTCDRIVTQYGKDIFRFNYDLWKDYSISFTPDDWEIVNPVGHSISSRSVTNVFWWKAFNYYILDEDRMISSEVKYIFKEIYAWCANRGMAKGNFIDWHNRYGKMNVLNIAKKYFEVPQTLVTIRGHKIDYFNSDDLVAKSLSSEISNQDTVLMTTSVNPNQIDPSWLWYLQAKIDSDWDATVFICGKSTFAFKRSREGLIGLDWRSDQDFTFSKKEWFPFDLDEVTRKSLNSLSSDLCVEFGRYDFMIDRNGNLVFLEFNANGHWVFLDYLNEYGLLDAVVDWLKQ